MAYKWISNNSVGQVPPRPPNVPTWWSDNNTVRLAVHTPSPAGNGDVLERALFSATIGVTLSAQTIDVAPSGALDFLFKGDVVDLSAQPPDPLDTGRDDFCLRASVDSFQHVTSPFGVSDTVSWFGKYTTRGYVDVHSVRGPAKYGGITPDFQVGVTVINGNTADVVLTRFSVYWVFSLHTLWKTV